MEFIYTIWKRYPVIQFLATFIGVLNVMSGGMHYSWTSPSLPKLQSNESTIYVTDQEGSTLAVIVAGGCVLGCLLTANLVNLIGRKYVVLAAALLGFIVWIVVAYARTLVELFVARFLGGISITMGVCSITIFISEIANPEYRGLLASSIGVSYSVGHLLINVIGSHFDIKTTALISSAVPLVVLLTFPWIPETPYFLLMKNKTENARRCLAIYGGSHNCEIQLNRICEAIERQRTNSGACLDLLRIRSNRKALFLLMTLEIIRQTSGQSAVLFYTSTIFQDTTTVISASTGATIFMGLKLVTSILSSLIVDKIGRKPLLTVSLCGIGLASLSLSIFIFYQHYIALTPNKTSLLPVIALAAFVVMFSMGLQIVPYILEGELFPTNVKGHAVTTINICFSITGAFVSKYFQITKDSYGLEVPFFTFAICSGLGVLFVIFFLFETKGKTLEAIQIELKR